MKKIISISAFIIFTGSLIQAQIISSNTFQVTDPVPVNSINEPVLIIEIETGPAPVTIANMIFNTNGSTSPPVDIVSAKLWHYNDTTNLNLFQANLIGTYTNPWGTGFYFMGNVGTNYSGLTSYSGMVPNQKNYFWLTYNISPGAVVCDVVDAEFLYFTEGSNIYVPSINGPAGNREIGGPCSTNLDEVNDPIFKVFPVPAHNAISVSLKNSGGNSVTIKLTDMTGRTTLLFSGVPGETTFHFSIENFSPGIYFMEVSRNGRTERVPVVRID